jgi:tetratricopeptide (TPR) repeat protein
LGAILYECLTGRPPFLAPNAIDTIYFVVHEEPVAPSAWIPKLPKDIETICLKCLEKDPGKRYASAKMLAEDLERFLDNLPIQARPVGFLERTVKWAKRRPAQAALVGTVLTAGVVALGAGIWVNETLRGERDTARNERTAADIARDNAKAAQAEAEKQKGIAEQNEQEAIKQKKEVETQKTAAEKARDEAKAAEERAKQAAEAEKTAKNDALAKKKEADEARTLAEKNFQYSRRAVDQYFTEVAEGPLLDEPNLEPLRKNLLGLARGFYEQFVTERSDDPSVLADLGQAQARLALITATLESVPKGIGLWRQALGIFEKLAAAQPANLKLAADVARTYYQLGVWNRKDKQRAAAEEASSAAVGHWERLICSVSPGDKEFETYQSEFARSLDGLGGTYYQFKNYPLARDAYSRALAIRTELADKHDDDDARQRDRAVTLDNIANVAADTNDFEAAEEARKKAREIFRELVKAYPNRTRYRDDLARNQRNLGNLYYSRGRYEDAVNCQQDAARLWDQLSENHTAVKEFRYGAGTAYRLLAQAQARLNRMDLADAALKKSRNYFEALVREAPESQEFQAELIRVDLDFGERLRARRQFGEAAEAFRTCITRLDELLARNKDVQQYKLDLARGLYELGKCLQLWDDQPELRASRFAETEKALQRGAGLWKEITATEPQNDRWRWRALDCLLELARFELDRSKYSDALIAADQYLKFGEPFRSTLAPKSNQKYNFRDASRVRAEALTGLGRFDDSKAAWDDTLKLVEESDLPFFNLFRRATIAHTPEYEKAVKEAEDLVDNAKGSGTALYHIARVMAIGTKTAANDSRLNANERRDRSAKYSQRALEVLQLSRKQDYFTDLSGREGLLYSKDWDTLRSRAEFQQLLSELKLARTQ